MSTQPDRDEETESGYENKARRIARELDLRVKVVWHPKQECPKWNTRGARGGCDHVHGDRYRITLYHHGSSLSFDFWNSLNDSGKGKGPGHYDVLACVASDAFMPTDPDEVVNELGAMPPSQAIAAARFARRLQHFFTEAELDKLSKIR